MSIPRKVYIQSEEYYIFVKMNQQMLLTNTYSSKMNFSELKSVIWQHLYQAENQTNVNNALFRNTYMYGKIIKKNIKKRRVSMRLGIMVPSRAEAEQSSIFWGWVVELGVSFHQYALSLWHTLYLCIYY